MARRHPTTLFDPVEEPFDLVASAIEVRAEADRIAAIAFWRDVSPRPLFHGKLSYHWFDYEKAPREILRVLKPDGALALIWNERDDHTPWVAAFSKILGGYAGDTPRQSSGKSRVIFEDVRFRHLASKSYPFSQPMPLSGICDRALSTSFIAALPNEDQDVVRAKVANVIEREPALVGQDKIAFPYMTELHLFGTHS